MKKKLLSCMFFSCAIFLASAQDGSSLYPDDGEKTSMNFVKINVLSPLIKNYSFQYERVLSKDFSVGLSFRIMPETGLPFKNLFYNIAGIEDPDEKEMVADILMSNYAITPEFRYYPGKKKYGKGFYLSLFYRYGSYNINNLSYETENNEEEELTIDLSADVKSHTGGLMIGNQWTLGKNMCLDFWILGPHFGVSSGNVTGSSSLEMTQEDQQNIRDEMNDGLSDADIPMFEYTISTTSNDVKLDFDGPWGGLRFGLSFGVRF
ncbi:MAG: DUF3575 domain-containing protein [Bacteroidales bacterium]|nr:DUF3575 domain-containing protein [Bacteroidales bacterium]